MSMSTSVVGIKPPDEKWKKMKAVWDSCKAAGVCPPKEVEKFFDDRPPDEKGVIVELDRIEGDDCIMEFSAEMVNGIEVDLIKLPPDIKIIRFMNSY